MLVNERNEITIITEKLISLPINARVIFNYNEQIVSQILIFDHNYCSDSGMDIIYWSTRL